MRLLPPLNEACRALGSLPIVSQWSHPEVIVGVLGAGLSFERLASSVLLFCVRLRSPPKYPLTDSSQAVSAWVLLLLNSSRLLHFTL